MTCVFIPCKCKEQMGNDFWFLPADRCLYDNVITPEMLALHLRRRFNPPRYQHPTLFDAIMALSRALGPRPGWVWFALGLGPTIVGFALTLILRFT